MKTLVIIPAYNEAPNIVHTVESLKAACPDVDYVVVNDCSGDDTAKICEEHGYTYLNLPINLGDWWRYADWISVCSRKWI